MRNLLAPLAVAVMTLTVLSGCSTPQAPVEAPPIVAPAGPDPAAYVVPPVPHVDAAALLADHAAFVTKNNLRADNVPTHESARVDLLAHFASYGLDTYRFNFTTGIPQADIMGVKWGVDREHWVFVGGHYDTTTWDKAATHSMGDSAVSQGAYDDGSGTMIAVHLAKAFSNVTPYYTIAFVAYDGEERGIQGAAAIVDDVTGGNSTVAAHFGVPRITIVGDLDLDMVGINWPGTSAPIDLMTNSKAQSAQIHAQWKKLGYPDNQLIEKDGLKLGSSDYSAFWRQDQPTIPTVFFISDFEEIGVGSAPDAVQTPFGAYPFWHMTDTVETMTAMAGGPGPLEQGFDTAANLGAFVVHSMACQPLVKLDAVAR
ncbi:MAG: M20/M25/M40 family metallo-hydrolase [bacterium]